MFARSDFEQLAPECAHSQMNLQQTLDRTVWGRLRKLQAGGLLTRLAPSVDARSCSECDPKFANYLSRLSHAGLQMLGAVEIVVPVLLQVGRMAVTPESVSIARLWQTAAMLLVGVITLLLSASQWSRGHARFLAVLSAWFASALLTWTALWKPAAMFGTDDYVLSAIIVVVLTAIATVPVRPWHALALGLSIEGMYILSCFAAGKWQIRPLPIESYAHHIFLMMMTLLATGMAAVNYQHRRAEYAANREAIRVAEALSGAQLRALLAENAISIGKMSATLSHEINSPVGSLRSSVETLLALMDRLFDAPPEERVRLRETRQELQRSVEESTARIDEVTRRLRRLANLEEAEFKWADLNELLSDVTLLHEEEIQRRQIRLELDLQKNLPTLICRPQLLSAVFSALLSNAIQAVNGDGRISISTHALNSSIEVSVHDNGRGVAEADMATLFDPRFKVEGGRVASGNWSLFNSRQIVYEHGGEIRVESEEGRGTTVSVTLPV
jgi:signal transduction histidine kinase